MKKYFITSLCILVGYLSFSQINSKEYNVLIDKADSLYEAKEYKNAASTYSTAIRTAGLEDNGDRFEAACSWALAYYPDSAFFQLNILINSKNFTFKEANGIINTKDLIPLYNDTRWQSFKDKMFLNAYKTFLTVQKKVVGNLNTPEQNDLTFARALGNNSDSAFSNLNDAGYLFLRNKMYDKAYKLFKVSIDNFKPNQILYLNMADYYKQMGDKGRAYIYFSRAEVIKYKQPNIISDTLLKIDSVIKAEYWNFSKTIASAFLPPEYLITMVANSILKKGMTDKAYALLKMNIENYPNSFTANKEMGNIYDKKGDKENANEYFSKSLILQYKLPENFFQPSFNVGEYIILRHDSLTKQPGRKVRAPETFVNDIGIQFLAKKMFDKAELLFKMNVENYTHSMNVYKSMSNYYKATNDKIKEKEFNTQAEIIKSNYGAQSVFPGGPIADTTFNSHITAPSCLRNCPTILFDEMHNTTGLTINNAYRSFVNLMTNDGFRIIQGQTPFTKQSLAEIKVVVFAGGGMTKDEILILNDWIRKGGSLLAMTHHDGGRSDEFLQSLGVQTLEISITQDSIHGLLRDGFTIFPSYITFSKTDKQLGNHLIIKGRNNSETIRRVQTFAGRTIIGPPGSSMLLKLSESAVDFMDIDLSNRNSRTTVKTTGLRSHGVAFTFGKGKVVVCDAGAVMALLFEPSERGKMGMNTLGSDNKQYALNIMRWLTGYLK